MYYEILHQMHYVINTSCSSDPLKDQLHITPFVQGKSLYRYNVLTNLLNDKVFAYTNALIIHALDGTPQ